MKRLASVDIGSNTVHALVADVDGSQLVDVAHYSEMPELGPHVAKHGEIGAAQAPAIAALKRVVDEAREHKFEHLVAGATAAVRTASDGAEFAEKAGQAIGVPMRILKEEKEAHLTFAGAASKHAGKREWLLTDLGGGSMEVVIGRDHELQKWATLHIGSGVLSAQFLSDPPTSDERAKLRREALRLLRGAPDADVERVVATGGTAVHLPSVLSRQNPPPVLTTADLLKCAEKLDESPADHLAKHLDLELPRVKALRGGVEVLLLLLDWYGQSNLQISREGVRHGMLLAYLKHGEDWWR
jgi:exopolyphosphatase/guanosine-5'-triphosphate,3'-diphosphate pyrophosphatase